MRIGAFMSSYIVPVPFAFGVFGGQVGTRIGGLVNVNLGIILI